MSIAKYYNPRLRARLLAGDVPPWLQRHPRRAYIMAAIIAVPPWCDPKKLRRLREEALFLTRLTGRRHVLDHIIPLTHKYVCGLHVETNLRIVPYSVNAMKGNKFAPDQGELVFGASPSKLRRRPTQGVLPLALPVQEMLGTTHLQATPRHICPEEALFRLRQLDLVDLLV